METSPARLCPSVRLFSVVSSEQARVCRASVHGASTGPHRATPKAAAQHTSGSILHPATYAPYQELWLVLAAEVTAIPVPTHETGRVQVKIARAEEGLGV
jgi:hypothetical protein